MDAVDIPADWLEKLAEAPDPRAAEIEATTATRVDGTAEAAAGRAKERHQGGSKWVKDSGHPLWLWLQS
jgi:uncharacterized protein with von Willebrand factor type A (vWA) domain